MKRARTSSGERRLQRSFPDSMKHIERFSKPWNESPSRKVTFTESAYAVLKSSLGRFWPISLLSLFTIVFLPALIFINDIKLDRPLFVTEWLKLSIEGIIFFFILEIVRHRSLSFTARQLLLTFVTIYYVGPIQDVIGSLKHFREALESHNSTEAIQSVTVARQKWNIIEYALSENAISHLSNEGEVMLWLLKHRHELEPRRCNAILRSLSTVQNFSSLNVSEFEELLNRLEAFSNSIKSL